MLCWLSSSLAAFWQLLLIRTLLAAASSCAGRDAVGGDSWLVIKVASPPQNHSVALDLATLKLHMTAEMVHDTPRLGENALVCA